MYDVVVVGGGIGGLTVAALLSARGVNTCLFERQPQPGGCIARVEFSGYDFEPGMGLYTSFGPGGIYQKLFAQLPVDALEVSRLTSPYVMRLADGTDVRLNNDDLYLIAGGPASLAERLAESIKVSGGTVRLNSPVLRLAYDESGAAIGVDLLSGERVFARKAIVSNLTIWDTYGKLVGLNRTPSEIRKRLNTLHGSGVFVIYAAIEEPAAARLPGGRMLVKDSDGEFSVAITENRAATFITRTEIEPWFSYQTSEEDYEEWDQAALEQFWKRIHSALPELGSAIEIIETANPRTYYDLTRRKLGMILGLEDYQSESHRTFLPNLFLVGDTTSEAATLDSVVKAALALTKELV
jgi:phytoene dehydrogenase-like protein